MKIYPVEGRTVRDPRTRAPVPAQGLTVSDYDPFWARRLRDGDVTKTAPQAEAKPAEAPAAQPETTAEAPAAQPETTAESPAQESKS